MTLGELVLVFSGWLSLILFLYGAFLFSGFEEPFKKSIIGSSLSVFVVIPGCYGIWELYMYLKSLSIWGYRLW